MSNYRVNAERVALAYAAVRAARTILGKGDAAAFNLSLDLITAEFTLKEMLETTQVEVEVVE